jgi:hypothetical protein
MTWHNIELAYQDDNFSLCPRVAKLFERQANFFSAETIFQGSSRFRRRARDYHVELNSVFYLADLHGASKQATAWHFAEEQDYPVAALYYYPHRWQTDEIGNSILAFWKAVASPKFLEAYSEIDIPDALDSSHPWAAACTSGKIMNGTDQFRYGAKDAIEIQWQSWWNRYTLVVLLRRKPAISSLSSFLLGRST